jgi:hypothetical protein
MIKALFKLIILFSLLLFNVALLIWSINQLELIHQTPLKKKLINNVQAEATLPTPPPAKSRIILGQAAPKVPHPTHRTKPNQRVILHFQSQKTALDKTQQNKLQKTLQQTNITSSHAVQVLFGPAPSSEKNIQSPLKAKLRAQVVARFIYPYTQTIKMLYQPSLKPGEVIVEFFEPQQTLSQ